MISRFTGQVVVLLVASAPFVAGALAAHSRGQIQPPTHAEQQGGSTSQELIEAEKLDVEVVKLYQQGKFDEAIPLAKRALKIREKLLPANDPLVADGAGNLALLYLAKMKFDDAESFLKRALSIYEKHPAANALLLAKTLENLGQVRISKGDGIKAEQFYLRALAIKETALSANHDEIGHSLNNVVEFYVRDRQYGKAKPLLQRYISLEEQKLGESDPQVGRLLERMACLMQRNNEKAEGERVEARANHILYGALAKKPEPVSLPIEVFGCKLINNPRPDLRSVARGRGLPGSIKMEVAVETDEAGNVTSVRYVGSDPAFKSVAEKAALGAKLRPTIVDGRAVKVAGVITHQFLTEVRMVAVPVGRP